jgi:hypothetical protein
MRSIEQVLTKPQRGKYKKLLGEPFSFEKPKETPAEKEPDEKATKVEPSTKSGSK